MSISRRSFLHGAVAATVAGPAAITTAEWPLTLAGVSIVFDSATVITTVMVCDVGAGYAALDVAMRENLYGDRSHRD